MKKVNGTTPESVEAFLARGGKIQQVAAETSGYKQRQAQLEAERFTDASMRDAENRKGCYSAYWGRE
jgi:hypothetical protein